MLQMVVYSEEDGVYAMIVDSSFPSFLFDIAAAQAAAQAASAASAP